MPAKQQQDHYDTLGIARGASEDEIRKAYRRLARKYHPDLNPGDKSAEDRFKSVQGAYDILSDSKKRAMYDQYGFYSDKAGYPGTGGSGSGGGQESTPNTEFGGFDFTDFARDANAAGGGTSATGGFQDIFSRMFGQQRTGRQAQHDPEKGADLEYALNIDFWQAIRGTQVPINVQRHEICGQCGGSGSAGGNTVSCPDCSGTGNVTQMAGAMKFSLSCPRCNGAGRLRNACPTCRGDGRMTRSEMVEVRIPAGAQNGSRMRVAGKGNAGSYGAPPGDLYITIRTDPHPFFRRNGDDIEITVPVRVDEAYLGAKIEVPTIDGRALLKIPPGTRNLQKFRLREKGVASARKSLRGDQIVEVSIEPPKVQDERTKELLRELGKLHPEDPRAEIWAQV